MLNSQNHCQIKWHVREMIKVTQLFIFICFSIPFYMTISQWIFCEVHFRWMRSVPFAQIDSSSYMSQHQWRYIWKLSKRGKCMTHTFFFCLSLQYWTSKKKKKKIIHRILDFISSCAKFETKEKNDKRQTTNRQKKYCIQCTAFDVK